MCVFSVYVDLICRSYCIDPNFSGKIVYVDVFVVYSVLELYGVPFVPKLCRHVVCLCYVSSSMSMCLFTVYVHVVCLCYVSSSMSMCLFTVYVHVVCLYVSFSVSISVHCRCDCPRLNFYLCALNLLLSSVLS